MSPPPIARQAGAAACLLVAVLVTIWVLRPTPPVSRPAPPTATAARAANSGTQPPAAPHPVSEPAPDPAPDPASDPALTGLPEHDVDPVPSPGTPPPGQDPPDPPPPKSAAPAAPPVKPSAAAVSGPPASVPPGPQTPGAPSPFAEAGALEAWASLLATEGVAREVVDAQINDPTRSDVTPPARAQAAANVGAGVAVAYLSGQGRDRFPGRWEPDEVPTLDRVVVRAAGAGRRGTEVWVLVVVDGVDRSTGQPVAAPGRTVLVPVIESDGGWRAAPRPVIPGGGEGRRGV